jgi:hypothetical protein
LIAAISIAISTSTKMADTTAAHGPEPSVKREHEPHCQRPGPPGPDLLRGKQEEKSTSIR